MTDWAKLKVVDLKAELKKRGLPPAGNKADLVARLRDADDATKGASHQQPDQEDADLAPTSTEAPGATREDSPPVGQDSGSPNEVLADDPHPAETVTPDHTSSTPAQPRDDTNTSADQPEAPTDPHSGTSSLDAPASADTPQKRKRRSISLSPSSKAKRIRQDEPREATSELPADERAMGLESSGNVPQYERDKRTDDDVDRPDDDRVVAPATHPTTTALYIKNFMRPLRPTEVEKHLATLAAAPRGEVDESVVTRFWLDPIRTHAFVEFSTVEAACRVRSALHGAVWPQESNRKELWVDFIPPEYIKEWTDREEESGGRRASSVRFEVVYDETDSGVLARLVEAGNDGPSRLPPPSAPHQPPTGPRVHPGVEGAPLAPRAEQQRGRSFRPRLDDPNMRTTRTGPMIYWKPVAEDLARRRIHNMRQFYNEDARITADDRRNNINRYFFEDGDKFVDRGKEIFAGIRPPHREREHRRMMRLQRERGGDPRVPERDRARDPHPVSQSFRPSGGDRFTPSSRTYDSYRGRDDRDRGGSYRSDDRRYGGGRDRGSSYREYRDRRY